jgi:2-succinyl-5-enolpyruvyl-6-hydroxy-3-cyclohexene-1-carboxylate synthase
MANNSALVNTYRMLARAVAICHAHGLKKAVLSPGSRSAPVALSFLRNPDVECYIIPDERSAAYTALGMARQLQQPVALVCTSGTAALNYGPAVAEAFFTEQPLIIMTADRPAEWLGQADNQAIYQQGIYGRHVKASFSFPMELEHLDAVWYALRIINEAMNMAMAYPQGPVHINIPLREPLYMEEELPFEEFQDVPVFIQTEGIKLDESFYEELKPFSKILVVAGSYPPDVVLDSALESLSGKDIVVIPDITSNLLGLRSAIPVADFVLDMASNEEKAQLCPDLLISFGGAVVSKNLKVFLRNSSVKAHWHLGHAPNTADTFQKLSRIIPIHPRHFFAGWKYEGFSSSAEYHSRWMKIQENIKVLLPDILGELNYSEIRASYEIFRRLPGNSVFHLGNSLPVRYASMFPFIPRGIEIYSNRGTSGIDGALSSAAGQSMVSDKTHILLTGDLSFLYDSNGLWNNYLKGNFKIIVFNNHGGGIFRTLPGPVKQKELEEYFVVKQPLHFGHLAAQFGCGYIYHDRLKGLGEALDRFLEPALRPMILELNFTEALLAGVVREKLRKIINTFES